MKKLVSLKDFALGIKFITVVFSALLKKSTANGDTDIPAASNIFWALGMWNADVTNMTLGFVSFSSLAIAIASWFVFWTFSVIRMTSFEMPFLSAISLRYSPSGVPTDQGNFPPVNINRGAFC